MKNQCPNCGFPCDVDTTICPNCHHLLSLKIEKRIPPIIKDPPKIPPPGSPRNDENYDDNRIYIDPNDKNGTQPSKKKFRPLF